MLYEFVQNIQTRMTKKNLEKQELVFFKYYCGCYFTAKKRTWAKDVSNVQPGENDEPASKIPRKALSVDEEYLLREFFYK